MRKDLNLLDLLNFSDEQLSEDALLIRNYFVRLIRCMPNNVYWVDKNGITLGCNNDVLKFVGVEKLEDIVGKSYEEITEIAGWTKEQGLRLKNADQEVIRTGRAKVNLEEPVFYDSKGEAVHYLSNRFPLYDDNGEIIGIVGVSINIADRKKIEAELKASQEREAEIRRAVMILSGSMAHDLRNPLIVSRMTASSIKKYFSKLTDAYKKAQAAGLVDGEELTHYQLDYLANAPDKLLEYIEQMNTFIDDDLKTISHVVSGSKSRDDLIECRINSCVTKAISHYPFEAGEKELVDWQSGGDFVFLGNPVLFYRIIFNLLKNALYQIKKHNKGKIYISTELKGDANILSFKDTAGGVTNEVVFNLFQDFNTTKKEGTGIGLAFCKFTTQSFGGDIIAQCVDEDYIEFVLSFPAR